MQLPSAYVHLYLSSQVRIQVGTENGCFDFDFPEAIPRLPTMLLGSRWCFGVPRGAVVGERARYRFPPGPVYLDPRHGRERDCGGRPVVRGRHGIGRRASAEAAGSGAPAPTGPPRCRGVPDRGHRQREGAVRESSLVRTKTRESAQINDGCQRWSPGMGGVR